MTIKRMLFRLWVRTLEFITLNNKPTAMCNLSLSSINNDKHTDIITVALIISSLFSIKLDCYVNLFRDHIVKL